MGAGHRVGEGWAPSSLGRADSIAGSNQKLGPTYLPAARYLRTGNMAFGNRILMLNS